MGKEKAFMPCAYVYRGGAGEAPTGSYTRPAPAVLFDIVNPATLAIPIAMAPCAPLAGSPDGWQLGAKTWLDQFRSGWMAAPQR